MDPRAFLRAMESGTPFMLGAGLNGLNPLATLNGIDLQIPPEVASSRSKLAREQAVLDAKVVQIIVSGDWETLKPNSRKSVSVGGHHICVSFREDTSSGYRIWEWHGHILMFDGETGYTPEYIYGNYFQPLQQKASNGNGSLMNGVGLSGIINGDSQASDPVVHRSSQMLAKK